MCQHCVTLGQLGGIARFTLGQLGGTGGTGDAQRLYMDTHFLHKYPQVHSGYT
jgi:hypothetical protein